MFCKKCGKQVEDGTLTCNYCGAALNGTTKKNNVEYLGAPVVQPNNAVNQNSAGDSQAKPQKKKLTAIIIAIVAVLVVVAFLITAFVAPGFLLKDDNSSKDEESSSEVRGDKKDSDDDSDVNYSIESTTNSNENSNSNSAGSNKEISFSEIVVVDNDECVIKITDFTEDKNNYYDYVMDFQFENKSAGTKYSYRVANVSVNGICCEPSFSSESVAPGKKCNSKMYFDNKDHFYGNDIGDYTDIEITFYVRDADDYDAENVVSETVHVYPYGKDKAVKHVRQAESTDVVIMDNENAKVTVIGQKTDSYGNYYVNLYIENKSSESLDFRIDNDSVNGYMIDSSFYTKKVSPGKCMYAYIEWYDEYLDENGVDTVTDVEFDLILRNNDYDILAEQNVKLTA